MKPGQEAALLEHPLSCTSHPLDINSQGKLKEVQRKRHQTSLNFHRQTGQINPHLPTITFFPSSTEATGFGNGKETTSPRPGPVSAQHHLCPGSLSRSADKERRIAGDGKHKSTGTYPERRLIFMAPRMQRQSSMTTCTVPDSKFVHLMFAVMFTATEISIRSERRPTKLKKQMG